MISTFDNTYVVVLQPFQDLSKDCCIELTSL